MNKFLKKRTHKLLLKTIYYSSVPRRWIDKGFFSVIAIIEGDIVPDENLLKMMERSHGRRQKRMARKNVKLWDNGLIPYNISSRAST